MAELVMPRLSDTMEEGTILRWLKADGEQVALRIRKIQLRGFAQRDAILSDAQIFLRSKPGTWAGRLLRPTSAAYVNTMGTPAYSSIRARLRRLLRR